MWKDVRNKLSASTSDSLARRERERRKALCKITRVDEAGDASVVGGGCLFCDQEAKTDGWSKYFILTSSKLIPKEKCDVEKYHVEFIKPKSKSKSKTLALSSIVKDNIHHVSSGLVVIFINTHSSELKGHLFKHRSSSILKDLEPRIGCKQSETQFFFYWRKKV